MEFELDAHNELAHLFSDVIRDRDHELWKSRAAVIVLYCVTDSILFVYYTQTLNYDILLLYFFKMFFTSCKLIEFGFSLQHCGCGCVGREKPDMRTL